MKITGITVKNIPGLCKAQFIEVSKVKSITTPDDNYEVEIELKAGYDFDEIYFTPTAEDLSIEQHQDDTGAWYEVTAKLVNPYLTGDKAVFFKSFEQKDMIFVIEDNNGNSILIGSIDKPARLTYKMSIPGQGRNQRQITIDAIHDNEPYYVADHTTLIGDGFDKGFDTGFESQLD